MHKTILINFYFQNRNSPWIIYKLFSFFANILMQIILFEPINQSFYKSRTFVDVVYCPSSCTASSTWVIITASWIITSWEDYVLQRHLPYSHIVGHTVGTPSSDLTCTNPLWKEEALLKRVSSDKTSIPSSLGKITQLLTIIIQFSQQCHILL